MADFNFDQNPDISGNNYVRNNKAALNTLFGADHISPFWIADMEFKIDANITEEIKRIAERGVFSYEKPLDDMYPIICDWYKRRKGLELDPSKFEIVTGVLTGIAVMLQLFSQEGEEVIIQTPVYHVFKRLIEGNDRKVLNNSLVHTEEGYKMDLNDLEEKLSRPSVNMMVLCNPHNPMGRVWTREELSSVVELCKKHNVFLLSDEIHSDVILSDHAFTSITSFNYLHSASLLGSPAKTFGMQGSSCGFIYCPDATIQKRVWKKIESMYLFHLSTITVHATRMAYQKAAPWLDHLIDYTENSISWMKEFCAKELPQVKIVEPEGTYQVWLDFRALELSNEELDQLIIHKAGVGLTPGYWFGEEGSGYMRMNIGCPLAKIKEAFEQIKAVL